MPLNEVEQEYYADLLKEETETTDTTVKTEELENKQDDTAVKDEIKSDEVKLDKAKEEEEVKTDQDEIKKVETAEPEYKASKKYIPIDDEKTIYDTLDRKYRYDRMKPEEKALAFIAKENPGLDDDELLFIASSEYGIGVEKPDEKDLTDEQMISLKKQDIARKQLLNKADTFFKEEAGKIQLEGIDPLETDEGFKTYQTERQAQVAKQKEQETLYNQTIQEFKTATKNLSEIKTAIEIDIDDSKLAVDVNFKLDEKKQNELLDYCERYRPTDNEMKQFTDPDTGKFDFKGYTAELANRFFAKDILKAGIKQAIAQDREQFVEGTLKNSTLRNNDVSRVVTKEFDVVDSWPFGR